MSFNAGSVKATMAMDNTGWNSGISAGNKALLGLAAVVGTTIAALNKASNAADTWQKSLGNVSTMVDTNTTSMQGIAAGLLALDPKLGDTTELTDAMYQAFSSGATTAKEAFQITTDSATFAKAVLTDTSTAVDVLTTATNAYGKENVNTTQASDIFFKTIQAGKITGDQLSASIGDSIPLFASMGIGLDELGAGMATMTKQGIGAAESTTQLNAIVTGFLKPTEAMSEAIKDYGYESGEALIQTEGLEGALKFLQSASGGSKTRLNELFSSVRAVRGTLALTGEGAEIFSDTLDSMSGILDDTSTATDNLTGDTDLLAASVDSLTNSETPAITSTGDLTGAVNDLNTKTDTSITNTETLTDDTYLLADAQDGTYDSTGDLSGSINILSDKVIDANDNTIDLTNALKKNEGQSKNTKTMSDSVADTILGLGNSAIDAIGGIGDLSKSQGDLEEKTSYTQQALDKQETTWDTFVNAKDKVVLAIGGIAKNFKDGIAVSATAAAGSVLNFLMSTEGAEFVGKIIGNVAGAFKVLQDFMKPITEVIGPGFRDIIGEIKTQLTPLNDETNENVGGFSLLATASQFLSIALGFVFDSITGTIRNFANLVRAVESVSDTLQSVQDAMLFDKPWSEVKENAANAVEAFKTLGKDGIEGLKNNFKDVGDKIVNFSDVVGDQAVNMHTNFTTTVANTTDFVRSTWGAMLTGQTDDTEAYIKSMMDLWNNLTDAQEEDTEDQAENAEDANDKIENDTKNTVKSLKEVWDEYIENAKFSWEGLYDNINTTASWLVDGLSDYMSGASDNLLDQITLDYQAQEQEAKSTYEAQVAALDLKLKNNLISEKQYKDQLKVLDSNYDKEKKDLDKSKLKEENDAKRKAFDTNKKFQIADIWINAFASIASWWSTAGSLGPAAGPIFAGVMTAAALGMAGLQTSNVAKQQFVPSYQGGGTTDSFGSGTTGKALTRINESGGELTMLPDGTKIIPHDLSRDIYRDSFRYAKEGNTIYIDFDGANFGNMSPDAVANAVSRKLGRKLRVS